MPMETCCKLNKSAAGSQNKYINSRHTANKEIMQNQKHTNPETNETEKRYMLKKSKLVHILKYLILHIKATGPSLVQCDVMNMQHKGLQRFCVVLFIFHQCSTAWHFKHFMHLAYFFMLHLLTFSIVIYSFFFIFLPVLFATTTTQYPHSDR